MHSKIAFTQMLCCWCGRFRVEFEDDEDAAEEVGCGG